MGVARALAADPPVLLMDEPFGAVDPVVRVRLQDEFLRIQRELGKTVVFVTHDIDEAVKMGDRVAVFAVGGRLAQFGTPAELLAHPADEFVEDFVGATRGLRRLTVTPIDPTTSSRWTGSPWATSAPRSTSTPRWRRRSPRCCATTRPMVGVKEGAEFVGVLTPNGVHRAWTARLSLAD